MRAEIIHLNELSGLTECLAPGKYLPLAYLPGVNVTACAEMQRHVIESRMAQLDREAFAVNSGGRMTGLALLEPLAWDSSLYGFPMARISVLHAHPGTDEFAAKRSLVRAVLGRAKEHGYRFLDTQAHVADLKSAHALSAEGFRCMDTHVAIVWDLTKALPAPPKTEAVIVDAVPEDYAELTRVSGMSYAPYSRFAVDDDLPRDKAEEVFRQWAGNSLRGYADRVQLARIDGVVVGFCTWRVHKLSERFLGLRFANLDLTGVLPQARGKGVLTAMVHDGLRCLQERGVQYAEVLTHALNTGMQRGCFQMGGKTLSARHGFHWHAAYRTAE